MIAGPGPYMKGWCCLSLMLIPNPVPEAERAMLIERVIERMDKLEAACWSNCDARDVSARGCWLHKDRMRELDREYDYHSRTHIHVDL